MACATLAVILLQALSVVAFSRNSMHIEMSVGRDMRRVLFHPPANSVLLLLQRHPGGLHSDPGDERHQPDCQHDRLEHDRISSGPCFTCLAPLPPCWSSTGGWRWWSSWSCRPLPCSTGYFQNRILHWNRKVRKINSQITGAFNEGITGAKTSKTLVIEDQNTPRVSAPSPKSMHDAGIRAARLNAVYIPAGPLLLHPGCGHSCSCGAATWCNGRCHGSCHSLRLHLLRRGYLSSPSSMTGARTLPSSSPSRPTSSGSPASWTESPQVRRYPGGGGQQYGDAFHPKTENWEPIRGDIEFRDVTFRYPDGE